MTVVLREVLTPDEVAALLRVSRKTIYRSIRNGELIAARVGRQYRIPRRNIDLFLASKSTGKEAIQALFERVAEVALRYDFEPEEIERDIAEAIEAVRRSAE
ncbi:MAG: helix-turn-helix domain-containing protein [Anaerolineae bacterium]|jgi:excisionase family DNA binding protein